MSSFRTFSRSKSSNNNNSFGVKNDNSAPTAAVKPKSLSTEPQGSSSWHIPVLLVVLATIILVIVFVTRPKGEQGQKGDTGPKGDVGADGASGSLTENYTPESSSQWQSTFGTVPTSVSQSLNLIATNAITNTSLNSLPGFDIIIAAGSANATGNSSITTIDPYYDFCSNERILQLGATGNYNNKLIKATEPLQHPAPGTGSVGFEITFVKEYSKSLHRNRSVLLVSGASVSGNLAQAGAWSTIVQNIITRTNTALTLGPYPANNVVVGVLFHGGELEAQTNMTAAAYNTAFDSSISTILSSITSPTTSISSKFWIINGSFTSTFETNAASSFSNFTSFYYDGIKSINNRYAHAATAANTGCYDINNDPNYASQSTYFTPFGYRQLGMNYFKAYESLF